MDKLIFGVVFVHIGIALLMAMIGLLLKWCGKNEEILELRIMGDILLIAALLAVIGGIVYFLWR